MKVVQRKGWTVTPDNQAKTVGYEFQAGGILKFVEFDFITSWYEVYTQDTETYENDLRPKITGQFQNNVESLERILEKAELIDHFNSQGVIR